MWCALVALGAFAHDGKVAPTGASGPTEGLPTEVAVADPEGWTWESVAGGRRAVVSMDAAPFPCVTAEAPRPYDDASVWVFVPTGHDAARPVNLLVHLHGFESLLAQTVHVYRLVRSHALVYLKCRVSAYALH